jgi:hypothetical protein
MTRQMLAIVMLISFNAAAIAVAAAPPAIVAPADAPAPTAAAPGATTANQPTEPTEPRWKHAIKGIGRWITAPVAVAK